MRAPRFRVVDRAIAAIGASRCRDSRVPTAIARDAFASRGVRTSPRAGRFERGATSARARRRRTLATRDASVRASGNATRDACRSRAQRWARATARGSRTDARAARDRREKSGGNFASMMRRLGRHSCSVLIGFVICASAVGEVERARDVVRRGGAQGGTAERVQHHGEEDDDASAREIVRERVGRGVSGDGRGGVRGIERGDGAEATRRGSSWDWIT